MAFFFLVIIQNKKKTASAQFYLMKMMRFSHNIEMAKELFFFGFN